MSASHGADRPLDPRAEAAERALAELGFAGVRVHPEGPDDDIAVLDVPEAQWEALLGDPRSEAVRRVREAGFRFVALDLESAPPPT
jgi:PP-loop superfamily ATP-utilizing enzyme